MRRIISLIYLSIILLIALGITLQAAAQDAADEEPIKVVTKRIEPFVFVNEDRVSGFSIDIWQALAHEAGINFEYEIVSTIQEQLDAVANNEADVAIAAISITEEREEHIDFSHSYFESGLGILTLTRNESQLKDFLEVTLSPAIQPLLAGLIINIIIGAHAIWLIERRNNPAFPRTYFKGVWEGIWWSVVTVTTVGYGDKVPISKLGRLTAMIWMFVGLFIIANFTAGVTTELTLQRIHGRINGPEDLPGSEIVTVAGSTAEKWLFDRRINHGKVETIEDAYALLDGGIEQAIVYDFPVLLFRALQHPEKNYRVVPGEPFNIEDYGIVFPPGSPLREDINRALLRLQENGTYDQIYAKWYGIVYD